MKIERVRRIRVRITQVAHQHHVTLPVVLTLASGHYIKAVEIAELLHFAQDVAHWVIKVVRP